MAYKLNQNTGQMEFVPDAPAGGASPIWTPADVARYQGQKSEADQAMMPRLAQTQQQIHTTPTIGSNGTVLSPDPVQREVQANQAWAAKFPNRPQLTPEARLASQGNNATNQWAQLGGVEGVDPQKLHEMNQAAMAGRSFHEAQVSGKPMSRMIPAGSAEEQALIQMFGGQGAAAPTPNPSGPPPIVGGDVPHAGNVPNSVGTTVIGDMPDRFRDSSNDTTLAGLFGIVPDGYKPPTSYEAPGLVEQGANWLNRFLGRTGDNERGTPVISHPPDWMKPIRQFLGIVPEDNPAPAVTPSVEAKQQVEAQFGPEAANAAALTFNKGQGTTPPSATQDGPFQLGTSKNVDPVVMAQLFDAAQAGDPAAMSKFEAIMGGKNTSNTQVAQTPAAPVVAPPATPATPTVAPAAPAQKPVAAAEPTKSVVDLFTPEQRAELKQQAVMIRNDPNRLRTNRALAKSGDQWAQALLILAGAPLK